MENEKHVLDVVTTMGGISVLAAISRSLLSEDRRTFAGFLRGLVFAAFVSVMVGGVIQNYHLDDGMKNLFIGVAAFGSEDILMLIIKGYKVLTQRPGVVLDWIIEKLSGLQDKK